MSEDNMWMGGVGMTGEKKIKISDLRDRIVSEGDKENKARGQRGFWGFLGTLFSVIVPGAGHVLKLLIDQIAQATIKGGDPDKIREEEGFWTEGLAGEHADKLQNVVDSGNVSIVEGIIDQGLNFFGSEIGKKFLNTDTMKNFRKKIFDDEGLIQLPKEWNPDNWFNTVEDAKKELSTEDVAKFTKETESISNSLNTLDFDKDTEALVNSLKVDGNFQMPTSEELSQYGKLSTKDSISSQLSDNFKPLAKDQTIAEKFGFTKEDSFDSAIDTNEPSEFLNSLKDGYGADQDNFLQAMENVEMSPVKTQASPFTQEQGEEWFDQVMKSWQNDASNYGTGNVPSISSYFSSQGKTLGGNNKKTLREILGKE